MFEDRIAWLRQEQPYGQEAASTADLDRDGRLDVWLGGAGQAPRVLRNELAAGPSFGLRLRGRVSNPDGFGATVRVTSGGRTLRQLYAFDGNPFGADEARLVFALGRAPQPERVEVTWPSGLVQRVTPRVSEATLVVEEPDFLAVTPRRLARGGRVRVAVRAEGRAVEARIAESGRGAQLTPAAEPGAWSGELPVESAGVVHVEVRVDGAPLRAHPSVLVE